MSIIDLTKFRREKNFWEFSSWDNIEAGTEINHYHFEDLRKRLFLIRYPHAGRHTIEDSFSVWESMKWANGSATDLEDRQHWSWNSDTEEYDVITLSTGEYRFDDYGTYNGSRPYGASGVGLLKDTAYHYGGEITCYDGGWETTPTSHPDYSGWDTETKEQFLKDYPVREIEAIPFCNKKENCGGTGFTNSLTQTRPINKYTGEFNSSFWQRMPHSSRYYFWSPRVNAKIVEQKKKVEKPDPEASICNTTYWTSVEADRYLPQCTDPKEQNKMGFCYEDETYSYMDGKFMFVYKGKVEFGKYHISDPPHSGATGDHSVYCCDSLNGANRRWIDWPAQYSYCIRDRKTHPPTEWDADTGRYIAGDGEPYTEYKLSESFQNQIELGIDRSSWMWPVDTTYINNYLEMYNRYDDFNGTWTFPDGWDPSKYTQHSEMEGINGNYNAMFWNCNGSGTELFLKKHGRFNWYLDDSYPPMFATPKKEKAALSVIADNNDPRWIPTPMATWRRTWKEGFGKKDNFKYWLSEWGDPPGYEEEDCRMWITSEQAQYMDSGWDKFYRVVNLSSIYSSIQSKYAEASDINPSSDTKEDDIDRYYEPVQTVYKDKMINDVLTRVEFEQFELKTSLLTDMRDVMMHCRYGRIEPGVYKYQKYCFPYWGFVDGVNSSQSALSKYIGQYPNCYNLNFDWHKPLYMQRYSSWRDPSSFYMFGKNGFAVPMSGHDDVFFCAAQRGKAAIKIAAIDTVPLDAILHIRVMTMPFHDVDVPRIVANCTGCCEMKFDLGDITCECPKTIKTWVQTIAEDEDQFFEVTDLCDWTLNSKYQVEKSHLISFALTNNLFYETNWEDVPESVWKRDTASVTFRECTDCINPSAMGNDTEAPVSPDDPDKDTPDEPVVHLPPVIFWREE